jgi:pimeloyl-ACP methyl ester carboxylesterase
MLLTLVVNAYFTYILQMFTFVKISLFLFLLIFHSAIASDLYYCGTSFVEGPTLKPEQVVFKTFGNPSAERKVLLLHGMDAHGGAWKPLLQAMEKDATIHFLVPNLRGHGGTSDIGNDYHLWSIAREMGTWLSHVSPHSQVDIVGHSLGGRLGLAMVYLFPDKIKSLTILDLSVGSFDTYQLGRAITKLNDQNKGLRPTDSPGYKMMLQSWLENLEPVLEVTKIPVLFVGGDLSQIRNDDTGTMLGQEDEEHLRKIKKQGLLIERISGAGHLLHRTHATQLREILLDFWNVSGS